MATFYSNGKLLITGEYLVLKGAKAFALPTRFGQSLNVFPLQTSVISWKSYDEDGTVWYNDSFSIDDIVLKKHMPDQEFRNTLIDILYEAHRMNTHVLKQQSGFLVETSLTFPKKWGLGTSSTLINNIAQWFEIDAFELLKKSFGGSGYDIACAQNNKAVIYQTMSGKPQVTPLDFHPVFAEHIYFVYLNKKRNSREAIRNFELKAEYSAEILKQVSEITEQIPTITDFGQFKRMMQQHEAILSSVLQVSTVQKELFFDFDGVVKSLGAWGGDFVMVVSDKNPEEYFKQKGFFVILNYSEMIL